MIQDRAIKTKSRLSLWGSSFFGLLLGAAMVGGVIFLFPHIPSYGMLRCVKAQQACLFTRSYIGGQADWANVRFSDVVNLRHYLDRGQKASFSYLIIETKLGNFQMSMPSEYITKKRIAKLKDYLEQPVADDLLIEEPKSYLVEVFLVISFLMGSFFLVGSIIVMVKLCLNKIPGDHP